MPAVNTYQLEIVYRIFSINNHGLLFMGSIRKLLALVPDSVIDFRHYSKTFFCIRDHFANWTRIIANNFQHFSYYIIKLLCMQVRHCLARRKPWAAHPSGAPQLLPIHSVLTFDYFCKFLK